VNRHGPPLWRGGINRAQGKQATETKTFGQLQPGNGRRFNPVICTSIKRKARIGNPNMARATTNHVERTNLSVRLFNRRFTRKTMGFSKKLENHRWAVLLQSAHFNFCRVHSTIGKTPAIALGLADHVWTVKELLAAEGNFNIIVR
jgi:hypothetical protein